MGIGSLLVWRGVRGCNIRFRGSVVFFSFLVVVGMLVKFRWVNLGDEFFWLKVMKEVVVGGGIRCLKVG